MTFINGYTTLAEYKTHITSPGQVLVSDPADDAEIERIINAASRYIDGATHRTFYPRVETHSFDVPEDRELKLDDDLLEVITFTNGDDVAIASTDYVLYPASIYPKYKVALRDISTIYWTLSTTNAAEQVIDMLAVWGYRDNYAQRAWKSGGTLGTAISDLTGLSATMTAGHTLLSGQVWRIDNELVQGTVSANTLTFQARGDNGSTAATHANGATVKYWNVMDEVKQTCIEMALTAYRRRYGKNTEGVARVTAAGVVITPQDISETAARTIAGLTRRL